jgi:mRNA-degrading endonuclease RelE of RelBE toxin-antitoxin system
LIFLIFIEFTPEFKRNVRALSKKYRHIRSDIQPLIEQLEKGEILGEETIYLALYPLASPGDV